jgi:hypothetical protein
MRKDLLPLFENLRIRGFETDDNEDKDEESESEESEEEEHEGEDKDKPENTDALKSALRKERNLRKKEERDRKALAKRLDELDSKEKSETDKAKEDASKAESKALRLAIALKTTAVDNAIIKAAQKLKFRDTDDALKLVDREAIDVEQDEEDPSNVDLDEESVKSALETLAKTKPHLILADGQEDKSGSKFAGSRKSQKDMDEDALIEKFPALARSMPGKAPNLQS